MQAHSSPLSVFSQTPLTPTTESGFWCVRGYDAFATRAVPHARAARMSSAALSSARRGGIFALGLSLRWKREKTVGARRPSAHRERWTAGHLLSVEGKRKSLLLSSTYPLRGNPFIREYIRAQDFHPMKTVLVAAVAAASTQAALGFSPVAVPAGEPLSLIHI